MDRKSSHGGGVGIQPYKRLWIELCRWWDRQVFLVRKTLQRDPDGICRSGNNCFLGQVLVQPKEEQVVSSLERLIFPPLSLTLEDELANYPKTEAKTLLLF
jgi:hypothetical protein